METERFEIEPPAGRRESRGCLKGCLIVLVILLVLIAVLAFWASQNWRGWTVGLLGYVLEEAMVAANLPEEEQIEVRAEMQRLFDEFEANRLTARQVEVFADGLKESPLLTFIAAKAIEVGYLERSGLNDEEKSNGVRAVRRFVRGIADEEIPEEKLDDLLVHIADRQPDGEWRFRDHATDDQLRSLVEVAQREADAADIPEEAEVPSPSEELRRIIDRALAEPDLPEDHLEIDDESPAPEPEVVEIN